MSNCECNNNIFPDCDKTRWESCPSTIIEDADNYYTKYQVDQMLEEIESAITSGCCITPEEVESAITSAITVVEGDISAHTSNTQVHVTTEEKNTWNSKANVWCGSEVEWSQISGSTSANTIYLVY